MDLNTITDVVRRPGNSPGKQWCAGDAWLAGGTWLFSEPQPELSRLVGLAPLGWDTLSVNDSGLEICAMCTVRGLYAVPTPLDWRAASLLATSCEAFLASFKVWNSATVGGNICMSLPAGPMITITAGTTRPIRFRFDNMPDADTLQESVDAIPAAVWFHDPNGNVPRAEVLLVGSTDSAGPMASKGIAECCINPVAPALANALENATGVRFRELPLTPERIYRRPSAHSLVRAT